METGSILLMCDSKKLCPKCGEKKDKESFIRLKMRGNYVHERRELQKCLTCVDSAKGYEKRLEEKRQEKRYCLNCGREHKRTNGGTKYCSRRCGRIVNGTLNPWDRSNRTCTECSREFTPLRPEHNVCSYKCRAKKARNKYAKPVIKKKCAICESDFTTSIKKKKTCSRECGSKLQWIKTKEDDGAAMVKRLRDRLRDLLRKTGSKKSNPTLKLVGCSKDELRRHLESKFQPGMSWANRDKIHIDHIIPCASFDLTDPQQQRQCFHYTNLQPLWAKDNLSKGAKILKPVQMRIAI